MLGAITGDIVGSIYEWHNLKSKDFKFFKAKCKMTDDSYMTLALAAAILECEGDYSNLEKAAVKYMQKFGRAYPHAGYGGRFRFWLIKPNPKPYNSFGNGAAMRISPCIFAAKSMEEAKSLAAKVTRVTHNHKEGMKGAEATVVAGFMAKSGKSIEEIESYINAHYYSMDFTLDGIRESYKFNSSCQGTVPQALKAFFESTDFEDAIRNAISIGGDSDTLGAITGGVAQAYYGVPEAIRKEALRYMDSDCRKVLDEFEVTFMK